MSEAQRSDKATALGYMPQLDGLRAIAVAAVVVQHYDLLNGAAGLGVHLFFVLSGFLITGILMQGREHIAAGGLRPSYVFRQFYIRRALRIFPLYYLVVFVGILVNAEYARQYAPWLLTYTINLKMAAQGWYIGNFAHFWSLAIEEQYYLVWPWLILLLPRRWLVPAALAMTAAGPLYRSYLVAGWEFWGSDATPLRDFIATPTALDSLGMGSLIAILVNRANGAEILRRWLRMPLAVGSILLAVALSILSSGRWGLIFADTATAIFFGWLIYSASRGFSGLTGRGLSSAPLVFIGRISYGIYVYHPLVPATLKSLGPRLGIVLPTSVGASAALFTTLTVIIATISWYAFEKPMNELKRSFPYLPRKVDEKP